MPHKLCIVQRKQKIRDWRQGDRAAADHACRKEGQYSTKCPFLGFRAETIHFFIYYQIVRRRVMVNLFRINKKILRPPLNLALELLTYHHKSWLALLGSSPYTPSRDAKAQKAG